MKLYLLKIKLIIKIIWFEHNITLAVRINQPSLDILNLLMRC